MRRRSLSFLALVVLLLGGAASALARRPNVVLVVTDDQRWDEVAFMPTVSGVLGAQGVVFANAFVPTALCCPSRATILSGLYPHTHGVRRLGHPETFIGPDRQTLAVWLQRVGYRTGFFGKYLNGYPQLGPPHTADWYVPPGWTVWRAFGNEAHYYDYTLVDETGAVTSHGDAVTDYSTDVLRDHALAFMRDALERRRPFFAFFAPYAPHDDPTQAFIPRPAPRHVGLYTGMVFARPVSYMEADVSDKPAWMQALPIYDANREAAMDIRHRNHLAALAAVDEALAAMIALLDEYDGRRDTIIVFTSDNGFHFGEHRLYAKPSVYDEAIRVPLVFSYPRRLRLGGRVVPQVVCTADIAPTIARLAHAPSPRLDGRSLWRVARRDVPGGDRPVPLEGWTDDLITAYRGVRTRGWKYVEHPSTGEVELYDLAADPHELDSRDPVGDYAAIALELRALTDRLHAGE